MEHQAAIHVLVADDHEINQTLFKGLLEHAGYRVTLAANGSEVLGALRGGAFDLIIMDCMMPVMDGFEATRVIRGSGGEHFDPGIPILATTALAGEKDRERCLAAGMDDYLSKPVEAEVLFAKIQRLIRDSRPASRERKGPAPPLETILHSMSDQLRRDLAGWQATLGKLAEDDDRERATALAHKIRGLADLMGDAGLSRLAAGVETAPENDRPQEYRARVEALAHALGDRQRRYGTVD